MEQSNNFLQDVHSKIMTDTVLFFDMDGTLIDTNLANFLSYNKAIRYVLKSETEFKFDSKKRFNRGILKSTVPNLNDSEYDQIVIEKEKYYNEFLSHTTLNTAVSNILFTYSATHKTVLVTNCREERAVHTIAHHGLTDKFSHLFFRQFSSDNSKINKFQYAIQSLGILPDQVFVFENENIEVQDAIAAGINNYYLVQP